MRLLIFWHKKTVFFLKLKKNCTSRRVKPPHKSRNINMRSEIKRPADAGLGSAYCQSFHNNHFFHINEIAAEDCTEHRSVLPSFKTHHYDSSSVLPSCLLVLLIHFIYRKEAYKTRGIYVWSRAFSIDLIMQTAKLSPPSRQASSYKQVPGMEHKRVSERELLQRDGEIKKETRKRKFVTGGNHQWCYKKKGGFVFGVCFCSSRVFITPSINDQGLFNTFNQGSRSCIWCRRICETTLPSSCSLLKTL